MPNLSRALVSRRSIAHLLCLASTSSTEKEHIRAKAGKAANDGVKLATEADYLVESTDLTVYSREGADELFDTVNSTSANEGLCFIHPRKNQTKACPLPTNTPV